MPPPVLYDLTEFLRHPLRSGIPRVEYEILAHWPHREAPLVGVRLGNDGLLHHLPAETFERLHEYFGTVPGVSESARAWLAGLSSYYCPMPDADLTDARGLLNTEVFTAWDRIAFFERLLDQGHGSRLFFLAYDMLPWVAPEWFHQSIITFALAYLRLLRRLPQVGFISEQTRRDFQTRVLRQTRASGPVFHLGSDGLGTAVPSFDPACRHFAVVATLEPRKNPGNVLAAFERLWSEGVEVRLSWAGRMGWLSDEDRAMLERLLAQQPRFRWLPDVDDAGVRDLVKSCRATVYASWAEGYGLPPVESLALGVPVVVTADLPSVAELPEWGQVRLRIPSAEALALAVRQLLDDDFARRKHEEIPRLRLPSWGDLAQDVAGWVLRQADGVYLRREG